MAKLKIPRISFAGFAGVESSFGTQLLDGQFLYYDSARVITVALAGTVTFGTGCEVHGSALPAPN